MGRRPVVVLGVAILVTFGCSSNETAGGQAESVEPSVVDLLPEESMAGLLEFIEVSIRLGGADSGELLALGVNRGSLVTLALVDEAVAPAWCSGPIAADDDANGEDGENEDVVAPGYLVRVEPEAVAVATGDIERFELRVMNGIDSGSGADDPTSDSDGDASDSAGGPAGAADATDGEADDLSDERALTFEASFVIETGTTAYYVLDGTATFGDSPNSAVFAGTTADGLEIEGAFLCG